jgi:hypothetical protein
MLKGDAPRWGDRRTGAPSPRWASKLQASVELLSRAAKARIFRQSCAALVQRCQDLGISHGQSIKGSGGTGGSVVHPKFVIAASTASATAWSPSGTSGAEPWRGHHWKNLSAEER